MTWPTKTDFVDGDVLTAAQVNNIGTNLNEADPTGITDGYVLTADGAGGMGWEAVAADAWTSLASGSLSTNTVTLASIPQTYKNLHLFMVGVSTAANSNVALQVNGQTGSIYFSTQTGTNTTGGVQYTRTNTATGFCYVTYNFMDAATSANFFYFEIPNYTSSTSDRVIPFWTRHNSTSSPSGPNVAHGVMGITGYANAIDSVSMVTGSTFDAGTYVLYGEK